MKKTFKRSLSVLLSVLMVLSVLSAGMISTLAEDKEFTMIAVVAMKPEDGAQYLTTRFIFDATEDDLTALNGGPVDLGGYGYEAQWGIIPATSENPHERVDGNWDINTWGYDENGHLYFATKFPIPEGYNTPADEYAAAAKGELAGFVREFSENAVKNGIVEDALGRAFCPDLKANTELDGMDCVRHVLTTDEVYYAKPVATKTVMLNNCDSAEGWAPYPGDGLELTTEKKTEGTGSIHTSQGGGFTQGGPIAGLDLTGIQSISFDFAANTAAALSGPADVAFYLFSGDYAINADRGDRYYELSGVDTSKVMAFDVDAIRAGYGKEDESFATITTTPVATGENFDITNVTGFYFWGCTSYDGSHEQWIDNIVATVAVQTDEAVEAVIAAIDALPEAAAVRVANKEAIDAAKAAYDALSEEQKANVTNADKLTAVVEALEALRVNKEILLDDATSSSNWAIGGPGSCWGAPYNGHIWFWWLNRSICTLKETVDVTGAIQLKVDFTGSLYDGDTNGCERPWEDTMNKDIVNAGGETGIALTSYTGGLPTGTENDENSLVLTGEAWTDYAVRVKATEDVVKGMNTFEIDYTTAGAKFDPSAVTGVAIIGAATNNSLFTSTVIAGVWAVVDTYADPKPTDPAVIAVIDAIDALPVAADVTLADGDAITAAKDAYDALTSDQKTWISNLDKLTAAKEAYDALVATADKIGVKFVWAYTTIYGDNDKFEVSEAKTLTVKAKINAVGGSDQRYFGYLQLLGDQGSNPAGSRLNIADYEGLETEHNSRYNYDYKTLVSEIAVDTADTYKASFVYGGRKSAEIPNAALTVYEIEVYDGETLLASFCPAEDDVTIDVDPDQSGEKATNWVYVYGIKTLTPAEQVDELIDALPAPGSLEIKHLNALAAAEEAYNALTDEQKAEVKGAEKLNALLAEKEEKFSDILAQLAAKIDALPETTDLLGTPEEGAALDEIDEMVKSLTRDQARDFAKNYKDYVTKLNAVKAEYKKLVEVKATIMCTCEKSTEDVFDFCGNDHAMKDGYFWMNVQTGGTSYPNVELFNSVYVRAGRYFGEDTYTHSFNYNEYYQFEFLVNPDKDNTFYITHGNEDNGIQWQYPSTFTVKGNEWQRASCLITDIGTSVVENMSPRYGLENVNLLHIGQANAGEFYMKDIAIVSKGYVKQRAAAEKAFLDAVAAIGTVTADSAEAINAAKAARDELNNWINTATAENLAASATLDRAILDLALLDPANADVKAVYDKIVALPAAADLTIDNKAAVEEAKAAFDALTEEKQSMIPSADRAKLADDVFTMDILVIVMPIVAAIDELPDPDSITYENLADVKAKADDLKAKVDALTPEQIDFVTNLSKLEAVLAKVAELTDNLAAAKAVEDAIDALPSVEEVKAEDEAKVREVAASFNVLTDDQKALIPQEKKDKLAALVAHFDTPPVTRAIGDVNGDEKIDTQDALLVLQHIVGITTLEGDDLTAADAYADGKVSTDDALSILQFVVNIVTELPVKPAE